MRKFFLTLAAAALTLIGAGADLSLAQGGAGERIDRVSNQRLAGSPFSDLRGLSYQQCERRCLGDRQCMAIEHVRGGPTGAGASHCRLFRTFGAAHAAGDADVGYKRSGVAKDTAPPHAAKPAPHVTALPPPKPEPHLKAAPPHAAPAPKTTAVPSPPPSDRPSRRRRTP